MLLCFASLLCFSALLLFFAMLLLCFVSLLLWKSLFFFASMEVFNLLRDCSRPPALRMPEAGGRLVAGNLGGGAPQRMCLWAHFVCVTRLDNVSELGYIIPKHILNKCFVELFRLRKMLNTWICVRGNVNKCEKFVRIPMSSDGFEFLVTPRNP